MAGRAEHADPETRSTSNSRFARLLQEMGQAVIVTDVAGRITDWNRRAEELYGWRAEEVLGARIYDVTVPEQELSEAREIMEQLAAGRSWSGDFRVRRRDGSTFTAHVTDAPVHDADGRLVAVIGLSEDVTERRAAERLKDEFIGLVSHELRSPLTVITGMAQWLVRTYGSEGSDRDDTLVEGLREILVAAERLDGIVRNLLTLAFAEHEGVEPQPVPLGVVVQRVVDLQARRSPDRRLTLAVEPDLPPATGNETWVDQILTNLVGNAVNYSPEGEPIEVYVGTDGDSLAVRVLDRGLGVPQASAEEIFEPFRRGADSAPGIGLGLTVARRLAEIQRGAVTVRPRDGGGSEFRLTLPAWR